MNRRTLEGILMGLKFGSDLVQTALPLFDRQSADDYANKMISKDENLQNHLRRNPEHLQYFREATEEVYQKYSKHINRARGVDSWDKLLSSVQILGGYVSPALGGPEIRLENKQFLELVPKIIYASLYATDTGDYGSIPYFAAAESVPLIPKVGRVLGNFVDLSDIYLNRAEAKFASEVYKKFEEKVNEANNNPPRELGQQQYANAA